MSYVIFGSSNVYRHFSKALEMVSIPQLFRYEKQRKKREYFNTVLHVHNCSKGIQFLSHLFISVSFLY